MTMNDGGPAFPLPDVTNPSNGYMTYGTPGMSLRDYFAAAVAEECLAQKTKRALQAIAQAEVAGRSITDAAMNDLELAVIHGAANRAYAMADALLIARTKNPEELGS